MRVHWGRIVGAAVTLGIGAPLFGFGVLWLTQPSPGPVERFTPGPNACDTAALLGAGIVLHGGHEEPDETDRLAADVILSVARCGAVAEVPAPDLFAAFSMTRHALDWIETHETGEVALDRALTVWELSADQRRAGALVNFAVWTAIGVEAATIVERELGRRDLADTARDAAHRRLARIASAPVDWAEIHVREEAAMWGVVWRSAGDIEAWLHVPEGWWMLVEARRGTHRYVADFQRDEAKDRARARRLAID